VDSFGIFSKQSFKSRMDGFVPWTVKEGAQHGVTTLYITEAVVNECEFWITEELRYTPMAVQ
jgi:hypothetical protein